MSNFDHFDLDGHLLRLLLAVHEERSVTRAALRLGVTQSAVSHQLDRLRAIVGDPLFVRAGRGIVATPRTEALALRARTLLDELHRFVTVGGFDPATIEGMVTLAANDLQRDLLLPGILRRIRQEAPRLTLRAIPSGVPTPDMLRDGQCQLVLSPRPPDAADLKHKRLFEDRYQVFYDASCRVAPTDRGDYLASEHVSVLYEPRRQIDLDRVLESRGIHRRIVAWVPGYAGVPALLRNSARLVTAPALLRAELLRGFAAIDPPLPCPPMPMYMIWHVRHHDDEMHRWLRQAVEASVPAALAAARPDDAVDQVGRRRNSLGLAPTRRLKNLQK